MVPRETAGRGHGCPPQSSGTLALKNDATTLLTGCTGLLGSYVLRDLLLAGRPLAVIARPSRRQSAADRVEGIVQGWERAVGRPLPRPQVLEGNLTQALCGLRADDLDWIGGRCDQILHNAASLSFRSGGREDEPWRTNVSGTAEMLEVARLTGIRHVHHVSTAYTCGLRTDRVLETDLDVGQQFGNDYEESKGEAEALVRSADHLETVTIYRPSIIVGDSITGYTSTYHGFFAALRLGHTLLTRVAIGSTSGRSLLALLGIDMQSCKNFVPVDWVSAVLSRTVHQAEARGLTLHLTHPDPLTMGFVADIIQEAVESYSEAAPPGADDLCDEDWFAENLRVQLDVYERYFRHDPVFDRTHVESIAGDIPCPRLDAEALLRMAKFAIAHDFGSLPPDAAFAAGTVAHQPLLQKA